MLIKPTMVCDSDFYVKEVNFKSNTFRNDLYMSPVDIGCDSYGQEIYDVVLISEIVGDVPGANEYDPWDKHNLGRAFGKIVHHFSGRISEDKVDLDNPKKILANMTLDPIVSYVSSYEDIQSLLGSVQFYKYDSKTFTSMIYKMIQKPFGTLSDLNYELELRKQEVNNVLMLDIPNPVYPALRKYTGVPKVAELETCQYKGTDIAKINDLKVHYVAIDFAAEEKSRVERNNGIRALLGSPASDDYGENDPLVEHIQLGIMARSIAVDFMKADLGGMMESCTLIFDNKHQEKTGLYCGFKSIVSPFGEFYPVFENIKSSYIAAEFNKICKVIIGITTPRHYRVSLDCNQYEISVRISILDEKPIQELVGLYDFKKSVTIKMKKSEAVMDFVTQHLFKQQMLAEYNK